MRFYYGLIIKITIFFLVFHSDVYAQRKRILEQDTSLNNLIHETGYKTSILGKLPEIIKIGKGKKDMILIAGNGFGAEIFQLFMEANKKKYTMYAITLPGFGNTQAPPMPKEGTSYGDYTWSKGVENGILDLIKKERLEKPIIVGHFIFPTPIIFRLTTKYPELFDAAIIIGGVAKATFQQYPDATLKQRIAITDKGMAPHWFKTVTKATWDDNNYPKEVFCIDVKKASDLLKESNSYPLPVLVRYLCEFNASDISTDYEKLKVPTLVLIPGFSKSVLEDPDNSFIKTFFIDNWKGAEKNKNIQLKTIENTRTFMMIDQPKILNETIYDFLKDNNLI